MDERSRLLAEARAMLEWELELGGIGLRRTPRTATRSVASPAAHPSAPFAVSVSAPAATARDGAEAARVPVPVEQRRARLQVLADEVATCTACRLHLGRTKSVFARGSVEARIVFVGEGPGYNEDQQGLPFVGDAGQLLDKMIAAMGLRPDDVYVCNVVKCRPPENRTPEPDEAESCSAYLAEQLDVVAPEIVVALGRSAVDALGVTPGSGRGWRGQWGSYRGIPVMSTYHPAYLLRSPDQKRAVWEDLQKVMAALGGAPSR